MGSEEKQESVSLGPEEIAVIADYNSAARDIQNQLQGALTTMIRIRNLEGKWKLDGGNLVRAE